MQRNTQLVETVKTLPFVASTHAGVSPWLSGLAGSDCWDNAVSESFFATLEKELLALQPLQSRLKTRKDVANYIDNYYNLVRLHSHLDYVPPIEFETNAPT